ncbi:cobalamin-binding protein [Methyloversatilis thermotolerans]|uniref:cobalamin-binding protein n=1 Tax=Methyloversatilis thermotolerans TaxID=1346290 RepID=UPI0003751429|nr:cobalamin-binding protein [Methyloversatilis thermotolerans]
MTSPADRLPRRIACLCTEAVEVLYALGEADRIAGISGFTVRPPEARREKPKISGFSTGKVERILAVQPDLVLAFSDLQADLCRDLVRAGLEVHVFNQRSLDGILRMVTTLGALVGRSVEAQALVERLRQGLEAARMRGEARIARHGRRLRVYFEEWDEPLISGIRWVSELIELAGGEDVFADLSRFHSARERRIDDPASVLARAPDVMIASWCGKKFQPAQVRARPGWAALPAVAANRVYEIKSPLILAPGIAALTDGLVALEACLDG